MLVYKFQGKTINEEYNIYDIETMTFREMYTALSRQQKRRIFILITIL